MRALVAILALTRLAGAQTASPPIAAAVLANVQQFYAKPQQLDVQFRQTVTQRAFGLTTHSDGELWTAKPASFRADYVERQRGRTLPVKTFLFDGTTASYIDHKNKRITRQQVGTSVLPAAVSFITDASALAKEFTAKLDTSGTYGGKGDAVLELAPKQPSAQYKQLRFVVAPDGHVRGSIVVDSSGDTNQFEFFVPNMTTQRPASWFTVGTLPGYAGPAAPAATAPRRGATTPPRATR